jgi:SNF2 family DNA or RNA helicase
MDHSWIKGRISRQVIRHRICYHILGHARDFWNAVNCVGDADKRGRPLPTREFEYLDEAIAPGGGLIDVVETFTSAIQQVQPIGWFGGLDPVVSPHTQGSRDCDDMSINEDGDDEESEGGKDDESDNDETTESDQDNSTTSSSSSEDKSENGSHNSSETNSNPTDSGDDKPDDGIDPYEKNIRYVTHHPEANRLATEHFEKCRCLINVKSDEYSPWTKEWYDQLDPSIMRRAMEKIDPNWPGLKEHQKDAVAIMRAQELGLRGNVKGGLLAETMGLGKSAEIIGLITCFPIPGPMAVVVPALLLDHWKEELAKFCDPPFNVIEYDIKTTKTQDMKDADIVLITYGRLRKHYSDIERFVLDMEYARTHQYPHYESRPSKKKNGERKPLNLVRPRCPLLNMKWSRVIFDECQIFKNQRTATFRACVAVLADYRWCLTGTPFTNDYHELHTIFRVLRVPPFDDKRWFNSHFVWRVKNPNDIDDEDPEKLRLRKNDTAALDAVRDALLHLAFHSVSIRRTRESFFEGVLLADEIPPITRHTDVDLDDGTKFKSIRYMMKKTPKGYNHNEQEMAEVTQFFDFEKSNEKPFYGAGDKFKDHYRKFWPRNEQETKHPTRIQWSNRLRCAIEREAEDDEDEDRDGYPVSDKKELERIVTARLAACHYAVPGAGYGITRGKKGQENAAGDINGRKRKEARERFMAWLRKGENWRSSKLDWCISKIQEILNSNEDDKIIISCYSLALLDVFAVALKKHNIKFARFDGSMNTKTRTTVRLEFQNKSSGTSRVMLLSSLAGGMGLNLTAANHMIMPLPDWAPAVVLRAEGRVWITSQAKPCFIYNVVARHSIDCRVKEKQVMKVSIPTDEKELAEEYRMRKVASEQVQQNMLSWSAQDFQENVSLLPFIR